MVVISLGSIDGTRDSPTYADPNTANPSQNALASQFDGWQAGSRSRGAERKAEDAAVPGLIGLTQGGKADSKDQDEDQESADVETKAPHGMVPESLK